MESKKKYTFAVKETYCAEVSVEATSIEEARRIVDAKYLDGEVDVEFEEWSTEYVGEDLCDSEWGNDKEE